jgi:hypothetical protein
MKKTRGRKSRETVSLKVDAQSLKAISDKIFSNIQYIWANLKQPFKGCLLTRQGTFCGKQEG